MYCTCIDDAHATLCVLAVDEHAIDRRTVCTSKNHAALGLQGGQPALGGQLGVVDAHLAHQPRAGQGIAQDAGRLDVGGEQLLAPVGLVASGIFQLALLDIDGVVECAGGSRVCRFYLVVAVFCVVCKRSQ